MTTCSATLTTLLPVTSATVTPPLVVLAASRSTWSDPMPAVIASLSLAARASRSAVRYAGWKGVVMMISAVGSSRSKTESGPSLSEVVTSSWPRDSSHGRSDSSFSVVPRRAGSSMECCPPS
jgi:hypothetical protein